MTILSEDLTMMIDKSTRSLLRMLRWWSSDGFLVCASASGNDRNGAPALPERHDPKLWRDVASSSEKQKCVGLV